MRSCPGAISFHNLQELFAAVMYSRATYTRIQKLIYPVGYSEPDGKLVLLRTICRALAAAPSGKTQIQYL